MLFDAMFLNRYGGHETTTDTRMDQHPSQLVYLYTLLITNSQLSVNENVFLTL